MTKMQRPIGNAWAYLDRNRPRRAVFYGRVSTEHEAQLSALENQMQWYEDQAKYHPNWTIVGKYIEMCPPIMIQMHPPCTPDAP